MSSTPATHSTRSEEAGRKIVEWCRRVCTIPLVPVDLYIGDSDHEPTGRRDGVLVDGDLRTVCQLLDRLGLTVDLTPTTDFVLSGEEVTIALERFDAIKPDFESTGVSTEHGGIGELLGVMRAARERKAGLRGFGD